MNITFCGERGLINSIILDMGDDLEKHKKFLSSVKFAQGEKLAWISDMDKPPKYIIEPSFAMFGDPDLIIIAKEKNETRHVIFLEAKLCAYNDASEELQKNSQLPNHYKGNASKLNIQLAFKYRFAQAFMNGNSTDVISEVESFSSVQYNDSPRYLKKKCVIDLCRQHFSGVKDFYFVALTNDNANVDPYKTDDYLPAIGIMEWNNNKKSFGLLSYQMLEQAGVINRNSGFYAQAASSLLGLPADTGVSENGDKTIRTIPKVRWLPDQKSAIEQIINQLKIVIPDAEIASMEGSYSIKVNERTIVKIYADESEVFIALRNDNLPTNYQNAKKVRIGVGDRARSFAIVYEGSQDGLDDLIPIIREFVEKHMMK